MGMAHANNLPSSIYGWARSKPMRKDVTYATSSLINICGPGCKPVVNSQQDYILIDFYIIMIISFAGPELRDILTSLWHDYVCNIMIVNQEMLGELLTCSGKVNLTFSLENVMQKTASMKGGNLLGIWGDNCRTSMTLLTPAQQRLHML